MKKFTCKSPLFKISWLLPVLFFALNTFAQDTYYQEATEPGKGYWRVFTDYTTRSTIVKIFDATHQIVYEEVIAGKYIKLTKKNVRLLDQTLERLAGNQLVASTVKTDNLLLENTRSPLDLPAELLRDELKESKFLHDSPQTGLRLNSHQLIKPGKIDISFDNPQQERVHIVLKDENGTTKYEERTMLTKYRRVLSLIGLHTGNYTFEIRSRNFKFSRNIALTYTANNYNLQVVPTTATSEKKSIFPFNQ